MKIAISYADALVRYPKEVAALVAALRGSKSKYRRAPVESLELYFHVCFVGEAYSAADVVKISSVHRSVLLDAWRVDAGDYIVEYLRRASVSLVASVGPSWSSGVAIATPLEVADHAWETWKINRKLYAEAVQLIGLYNSI